MNIINTSCITNMPWKNSKYCLCDYSFKASKTWGFSSEECFLACQLPGIFNNLISLQPLTVNQ